LQLWAVGYRSGCVAFLQPNSGTKQLYILGFCNLLHRGIIFRHILGILVQRFIEWLSFNECERERLTIVIGPLISRSG